MDIKVKELQLQLTLPSQLKYHVDLMLRKEQKTALTDVENNKDVFQYVTNPPEKFDLSSKLNRKASGLMGIQLQWPGKTVCRVMKLMYPQKISSDTFEMNKQLTTKGDNSEGRTDAHSVKGSETRQVRETWLQKRWWTWTTQDVLSEFSGNEFTICA